MLPDHLRGATQQQAISALSRAAMFATTLQELARTACESVSAGLQIIGSELWMEQGGPGLLELIQSCQHAPDRSASGLRAEERDRLLAVMYGQEPWCGIVPCPDGSNRQVMCVMQPMRTHPHTKGVLAAYADASSQPDQDVLFFLGTICYIFSEGAERLNREQMLRQRYEFERNLTEIALRFINLHLSDLDGEIHRVLKMLCDYAGADRAFIYLRDTQEDVYFCTHEHCQPGVSSRREEFYRVEVKGLEWYWNHLRKERHFTATQSSLPETAIGERAILEAAGIKSICTVHMKREAELIGSLSLSCLTHEPEWTSDVISIMELAAEIIVNALDRKTREDSLRESESRNRALLESMPDLFFLMTADTTIVDYRAPDSGILYARPEEFLYRRMADVLPEEVSGVILTAVRDLQKTRRMQVVEYALPLPRGLKHFEARLSLASSNRIVVVVRDITDRKRQEDERRQMEMRVLHAQKLESLGVLAGGIAHDFNNLLMGILGNTSLALKSMPETARETLFVRQIETAALRAADLTKQLLAYSGKGRFVVEAVDLNFVVTEMSQLLETAVSKKARLQLNLHAELPGVEADATQIRQVVMNLITNASDAIGDKNGLVTVTTGVMQSDQNYLRTVFSDVELEAGRYVFLEVSDNGCGMDAETIKRVFEPFYSTKSTGRGLGLSAVQGIVRSHKGGIKVYSEPGKGTTFKIILPASDQTPISMPERPISEVPWRGEGLVLVADDEENIRAVVRMMLEEMGFQVICATDGREAVRIYELRHPEIRLVLLDMTMPEMNGEETFWRLRQINPGVRVILSSGYNEQDATSRFAGKGLAGFLQKPYQLHQLEERIRQVLRG
ncbi:MAG: Sensor histidine kinase RcsC [Myxococcota bacterium]|nr:Sensor histidine kinase RcsC [Myxococcota bacterium]